MNDLQALLTLLSQIKQIKLILIIFLIIILLCLAGIFVIIFLANKSVNNDKKHNSYKDNASLLLDKDDLDGVIKLSREKIRRYSKAIYAHWYLGQAYFRKKEWHKALDSFILISENAPSWKEHYTEPYIALQKLKKN